MYQIVRGKVIDIRAVLSVASDDCEKTVQFFNMKNSNFNGEDRQE